MAAPINAGIPAPDADSLITKLRFRHLRLIVALEQGGSLRGAAQALNLTQPALSKSLAELEGAFGFPLFVRSPRGLKPTAQGSVAIRGARYLLQELAHVQREAQAGSLTTAVLRIGAPPFVAFGHLPAILRRLAARLPDVRVTIREERVPLLFDLLAEGEVDALLTSYSAEMAASHPGLRYEKLFEEEFVVVAHAGHPLAKARRVGWQALAAEPWMMPGAGSMLRRMLDESFARAGATPAMPLVEAVSPMTNIRMAAEGLGLAAAPLTAVREAEKAGRIRRLKVDPPLPASPVALVFRAGTDNPRVAMLRDALT